VSPGTTITEEGSNLKASDIKAGDTIIIIGEPDAQGQIEARFIRVMPAGMSQTIRIIRQPFTISQPPI
ncbi:MAG: hypothetical protein ACREHG_08140, partial [Candidatus Saccharimonadales bacterium]